MIAWRVKHHLIFDSVWVKLQGNISFRKSGTRSVVISDEFSLRELSEKILDDNRINGEKLLQQSNDANIEHVDIDRAHHKLIRVTAGS